MPRGRAAMQAPPAPNTFCHYSPTGLVDAWIRAEFLDPSTQTFRPMKTEQEYLYLMHKLGWTSGGGTDALPFCRKPPVTEPSDNCLWSVDPDAEVGQGASTAAVLCAGLVITGHLNGEHHCALFSLTVQTNGVTLWMSRSATPKPRPCSRRRAQAENNWKAVTAGSAFHGPSAPENGRENSHCRLFPGHRTARTTASDRPEDVVAGPRSARRPPPTRSARRAAQGPACPLFPAAASGACTTRGPANHSATVCSPLQARARPRRRGAW